MSNHSASYDIALRRLLSLADYERIAGLGPIGTKTDLSRMTELAIRMGNPDHAVPIVHVAGTKGKGSTASMISHILVAAGKRVGLFTSPHLHTFRERLRIDGLPLSEEQFCLSLNRIWPHVHSMYAESPEGPPTTFEVLTAMALDLPKTADVDFLVLEAGLGGRLDSTNVVQAEIDVITSISRDHTQILGDTIAEIATEKAGIIKNHNTVVIAPQVPEARAAISERASLFHAPIIEIGMDVHFDTIEHDFEKQTIEVVTQSRHYLLSVPLLGAHQAENSAVAVTAMEAIGVGSDAIATGIASVSWDGRFQIIQKGQSRFVLDGAHNPYSIGIVKTAVKDYFGSVPVALIFGCSSDKEMSRMIDELKGFATHVITCKSRHPRAAVPEAIVDGFRRIEEFASVAQDIPSAIREAGLRMGTDGIVLVTGSLFVVAEALEVLRDIKPEFYPELDG